MFGTRAETATWQTLCQTLGKVSAARQTPLTKRERSRRTGTLCARQRADARTARVPEKPILRIPFATSMNTTVHLHGCPQSQPYISAHGCRVLERTVGAGAFRATDTGVTWRSLHAMQSANRDCNHAITMAIMQQRHVRQSRSTSTNTILLQCNHLPLNLRAGREA